MSQFLAYSLVGAAALAGYMYLKRKLESQMELKPVHARVRSYRLECGSDGVYRPVEVRS